MRALRSVSIVDEYFLCQTFFRNKATQCLNTPPTSLYCFANLDYNIKGKLNSFTSVRDEQTKTGYAYNSIGFVSYDDERAICDKTEYALDHSLHGYIIWEISGDLMPDLSTPLLDATIRRLNTPDVRCDSIPPSNLQVPTPSPTEIQPAHVPFPAIPTLQPRPTQTSKPLIIAYYAR